ncbi:MAG: hypothetical protein MUC96_07455 [Myxococcaceae bacterium]|nr:hypothetical protein [Myxococcaceae bacterium]
MLRITDPVAGGIPEKPRPVPAKDNRFQARFIMVKPFDPGMCWRGMGGARGGMMPPTVGAMPTTVGAPSNMTKPGVLSAAIESYLRGDVPELGLVAAPPKKPAPEKGAKPAPK